MTATLRYLIGSSQNRELLDFRTIGAKYTLDGVEYDYSLKGDAAITGNALPNTIWDAPGVLIDARQLLGGADVILFGGQWSDYSKALNAVEGTITFSRTVDGKFEQVTVANGQLVLQQDLLVFADGSVRTDTARKALINQGVSASVDDLKATGAATASNTADDWNANVTSSHPGALLPESPGGVIRGIASTAASFALPTAGVSQVLTGSAGVDQVYITPGATMDARQLLGGEDQIFFTGKWADYTKSLDSVAGTITFTRMVEGKTETAIVGNGQIALTRDLLVFADGAVRTDTARLALTHNPMASVADLKAQGALTTSTTADDWKTDTFTRWGIKAPLIDKVSSDDKVDASEKQAGVVISGSAEANSKVELEWGGVHKSLSADADGKWSTTFASTEVPSDGATVLSVTATDSSGYVSAPTTHDVLVDTVAPVAAVVQPIGGDGTINAQEKNNGVTIAGSAEPGSTVTVDLGGIEKTVPVDKDGGWQVLYPKDEVPGDGSSIAKVVVTDPAGNTTVEDVPLVIKTVAIAPVIDSVTADNIVNNAEKLAGVNVTGTAEAGSSVKVTWGTTAYTVTADADGKWSSSFALIEIPANGSSRISAVATDVAGNVSLSSTHDVMVDTLVSIPVINPVATDNTVNGVEKAAGVNVTGTAEVGSSVKVVWGSAAHTVTADNDGKWALTFDKAEVPEDGKTTISAIATDVAGNISKPGFQAVKVDTVIADPVINAVATDNMVSAKEKAVGVTVTGTAEAGSAVKVTWGSIDHTVTAGADGKWSSIFTSSEIPADGNTSISAIATDVAGNVSSGSQAVTVDTVLAAPTINVISTDDIVNAAELAAGVIVSGTAEAGSSVYVQWNEEEHSVTANADGKWSVIFDQTTSAVVADVIVQARDAAGNVSTVVSRALTADISVAAPVINTVATDDIVNATEKAAGVNVTGTAEGGSSVKVMWGDAVHTVTADTDGKWSATFAGKEIPADGSTSISAIATDVAGNISTAGTHAVMVDTVVAAPVINTVATDDIVNATEKAAGVNVTGTAEGGSSVKVMWGNAVHTVTAGTDGKWSATFAGKEIPADGNTNISAIATDVAGNISTAGTHAVKVDTVVDAPVINAVTADNIVNRAEKFAGVNVTGTAEGGSTVKVVWGDAVHTALAGPDGKWAATFIGNEIPADGNTSISAIATNVAGNISAAGTHAVMVDTVVAAPVINTVATDDIVNITEKAAGVNVTGTAEGGSSVKVMWGDAVHTVTAGTDGKWSATFAGKEIPADGSTSISAITTDVAGNVSTTSAHAVTVDTVVAAPVINTVATDDIVNATEKAAGVTVTGAAEIGSSVKVMWGDAVHTVTADADGKWSATFAGKEIPADANTSISAIATDVAGNISAAGTHAVKVDTVVAAPVINTVATDDIVNLNEVAAGVNVTGTAEGGSSVKVVWGDLVHTVTADTDGKWSSIFSRREVIPTNGNTSISAVATDVAGNISTTSTHAFTVDISVSTPTFLGLTTSDYDIPYTPKYINAAMKAAGIALHGTADAGSSVKVNWDGSVHTVTADANGNWILNLASTDIPNDTPLGSLITLSATDLAGNVSSTNYASFKVDTVITAPVINDVTADNIVNATEKAAGVNVTGTAEGGSSVKVVWGDAVHTVTAGTDGKWSATFAGKEIPADGNTKISAIATDPAGNISTAATHDVTVDTVVPAPVIASVGREGFTYAGHAEAYMYNDQYVNSWEIQKNFTVKGTAEAGDSLDVQWGSATHKIVVQDDGSWATVFAPTEVPADGTTTLNVKVTDKAGNSAAVTRELIVDTVSPAAATIDAVTGDNVINAQEKADGLTVTGTAEANGSVIVLIAPFDPSYQPGPGDMVQVDSAGHWSKHFTSAELPNDNFEIWATGADAAGNALEVTMQKLTYDTEVAAPVINTVATDDIVNATEKAAGVSVTGAAEIGSSVKVMWGDAVHTVTADTDGKWSATFDGKEIPADGSTNISAIATDKAGNISSAGIHDVTVDTVVAAPVINTVAGNDVVSAAEQAAGVTVSGTAEAGSAVKVVWDSANHTATADADGKWSATFTSAEVPGNGSHAISATATDVAGNVSTTQTHMVNVELNPVFSSDVAGTSNFDIRSDIVLKSSLAGHLVDGTWTIKVVNDANDATHDGYRSENQDNTQSLTFSVANGVVTDVSGGHVHMSADGKSIVLDPTFDLDLGNKYHIEAAAGMFKTDTGGVSDAFNGANFATVNPGVYNATDAHQGGVLAQKFDDSGSLVDSQRWVDITGNGRFLGAQVSISGGNDDYAFVVKDLSGGALETTDAGDGVSIDGDLNVLLTNFGKDDLLYIDQQDNSAPKNDMTQSTFQSGDGHATPLEYVGGAGGNTQDHDAKVDIQLESGLVVSNFPLDQVASDIHSSTGVVISG